MKTQNIINAIKAIIANGSTFAAIEYTTQVKTAAKFKEVKIMKQSRANVSLFGTLKDFEVYQRAVIKSANKIDGQDIQSFTVSDTYFTHDKECFSIVNHKTNGTAYLYAIFNNASKSIYTIDGVEADKMTVAQYLTSSEKDKLLSDNSIVYNKANDVLHSTIVRTIKIQNITSIKCNKMQLELNTNKALHA